MLWGGWGERKRERAGHDGKSPARFLFFFFDGDTQRKPLRRREHQSNKGISSNVALYFIGSYKKGLQDVQKKKME